MDDGNGTSGKGKRNTNTYSLRNRGTANETAYVIVASTSVASNAVVKSISHLGIMPAIIVGGQTYKGRLSVPIPILGAGSDIVVGYVNPGDCAVIQLTDGVELQPHCFIFFNKSDTSQPSIIIEMSDN